VRESLDRRERPGIGGHARGRSGALAACTARCSARPCRTRRCREDLRLSNTTCGVALAVYAAGAGARRPGRWPRYPPPRIRSRRCPVRRTPDRKDEATPCRSIGEEAEAEE
jgi:hypothetical protein